MVYVSRLAQFSRCLSSSGKLANQVATRRPPRELAVVVFLLIWLLSANAIAAKQSSNRLSCQFLESQICGFEVAGLPPGGPSEKFIVTGLLNDSIWSSAGIRQFDRIEKINGKTFSNFERGLRAALATPNVKEVRFEIVRRERKVTIKVDCRTMQKRKPKIECPGSNESFVNDVVEITGTGIGGTDGGSVMAAKDPRTDFCRSYIKNGLFLGWIPANDKGEVGKAEPSGINILSVEKGSVWERVGVKSGDKLIELNGVPSTSGEMIVKGWASREENVIKVRVRRDGVLRDIVHKCISSKL